MAMWLCCFNSQVSDFQNEANKILKNGTVYYTSMGLFCAIFRGDMRSRYNFRMVHFEMPKKAFA